MAGGDFSSYTGKTNTSHGVDKTLEECKLCEFHLGINNIGVRCNRSHVVSIVLIRPRLHDAVPIINCKLGAKNEFKTNGRKYC